MSIADAEPTVKAAPETDAPKTPKNRAASVDQSPLQGAARRAWEKSVLDMVGARGQNHLLHALFRFAAGKADCFPSIDSLVAGTKLSERHVRRLLGELAKTGVVALVDDRTIRTRRRIVFPSHPNSREVLAAFPIRSQGGHNVPLRRERKGDIPGTKKGDISDASKGDIVSPEVELSKPKSEIEDSYTHTPKASASSHSREGESVCADRELKLTRLQFVEMWVQGEDGESWEQYRKMAVSFAATCSQDELDEYFDGTKPLPSPDDLPKRPLSVHLASHGVSVPADHDDDDDHCQCEFCGIPLPELTPEGNAFVEECVKMFGKACRTAAGIKASLLEYEPDWLRESLDSARRSKARSLAYVRRWLDKRERREIGMAHVRCTQPWPRGPIETLYAPPSSGGETCPESEWLPYGEWVRAYGRKEWLDRRWEVLGKEDLMKIPPRRVQETSEAVPPEPTTAVMASTGSAWLDSLEMQPEAYSVEPKPMNDDDDIPF